MEDEAAAEEPALVRVLPIVRPGYTTQYTEHTNPSIGRGHPSLSYAERTRTTGEYSMNYRLGRINQRTGRPAVSQGEHETSSLRYALSHRIFLKEASLSAWVVYVPATSRRAFANMLCRRC